uniref:Uncharacterized protein n=1 Tax=Timema cristinae TaxID=61476 RepID=A0A7R9CEH3_TIMCR|nr:unnamed protein product [Timema cristinae]
MNVTLATDKEGYTLSQHSLLTEPPYFASSVTIDLGRWPSPSVVAQQRPFQPSSGRESPQEIKICPVTIGHESTDEEIEVLYSGSLNVDYCLGDKYLVLGLIRTSHIGGHLLLIALDFVLFVLSLYDMLFSRRQGGNPTLSHGDSSGRDATTFNNPGFRERAGRAVSVTDASGKPYATRPQSPNGANGSVASMATVTTTASSNGSTAGSITRSPLRSSLKKPRPKQPPEGGIGIQNPGFSGHSPTFSRNGSVKKVRIQTHSTAV